MTSHRKIVVVLLSLVAACGEITNVGDYRVADRPVADPDGGSPTIMCSSPCPAGQYQTRDCTLTEDRVCAPCTGIPSCTSPVTCTSIGDQQCTTCTRGYVLVEGSADRCTLPRTCEDLRRGAPDTLDGVYTIDPDGDGETIEPFSVYCDMTANAGGWTLIGKVGCGDWADLTAQQYIDQMANPIVDVGGNLLTSAAAPAAKEIAFFRRDRTNAIYYAKSFQYESVVRVLFDSGWNQAADGAYFQQRRLTDPSWDFWAAIRDARRWSTQPSGANWVSNYGADFALTKNTAKYDPALNVVSHDTGGDTAFGWWSAATVTLADGSSFEVSESGGLLNDGVSGYDYTWLMPIAPAAKYFKKCPYANRATIWLR